jgi:hypothetical protein
MKKDEQYKKGDLVWIHTNDDHPTVYYFGPAIVIDDGGAIFNVKCLVENHMLRCYDGDFGVEINEIVYKL